MYGNASAINAAGGGGGIFCATDTNVFTVTVERNGCPSDVWAKAEAMSELMALPAKIWRFTEATFFPYDWFQTCNLGKLNFQQFKMTI